VGRLELLRRETLVRLRDAYAAGHVSTGTFELRVGAALRARSPAELDDATWDLPRLAGSVWQAVRALVAPPPDPAPCNVILFRAADAPPIAFDDEEPRTWLVGRSRSCDITLRVPAVSRRHALISSRGGACFIRDLDSTNGLLVNGRRVTTHALRPHDVVTFGGAVVADVR